VLHTRGTGTLANCMHGLAAIRALAFAGLFNLVGVKYLEPLVDLRTQIRQLEQQHLGKRPIPTV
jgi:hypothetical protein